MRENWRAWEKKSSRLIFTIIPSAFVAQSYGLGVDSSSNEETMFSWYDFSKPTSILSFCSWFSFFFHAMSYMEGDIVGEVIKAANWGVLGFLLKEGWKWCEFELWQWRTRKGEKMGTVKWSYLKFLMKGDTLEDWLWRVAVGIGNYIWLMSFVFLAVLRV